MNLTLIRVNKSRDNPTFGVLLARDIPFAVTLERPWLNNAKGISCIPTGEYVCLRCSVSPDYMSDSPKFGNTFQIMDVTGRSRILFHKGNIDQDTHGCIIIGEQFGELADKPAVLASKKGFGEFLFLQKDVDQFHLSIVDGTQ